MSGTGTNAGGPEPGFGTKLKQFFGRVLGAGASARTPTRPRAPRNWTPKFSTPDEGCWGRGLSESGSVAFSRIAQTADAYQNWATNPDLGVLDDLGVDAVHRFFVLKRTDDQEVDAKTISAEGKRKCGLPPTARTLYMRETDPYQVSFYNEEFTLKASDVVNMIIVDTVLLMAFHLVEGVHTFASLGVPLNYITAPTTVASGSVFKFTQLNCAGVQKHRDMCNYELPLPPFAERLKRIDMLPPEVMRRRAARTPPDTIAVSDMVKGDVFMLGMILFGFLEAAAAQPGKFVVINTDMVEAVRDIVQRMILEDPADRLSPHAVFLEFEKVLDISPADGTWKKLGDGSYGCVGVVEGVLGGPEKATKLFYEDLGKVTPYGRKLDAAREAEEAAFIEWLDPAHEFTFKQFTTTYPKVVRTDRFDVHENLSRCQNRGRLGAHVLALQTGAGTVPLVNNPVIRIEDFIITLRGLLKGLFAFRKAQYVHHDISPRNIVLDPASQKYKFIDFGMGGTQQYKTFLTHVAVPLYEQWPPEFIAHAYTVPMVRDLSRDEALKQYASYCILGFINYDPNTGFPRPRHACGKNHRQYRDDVLDLINATAIELHGRPWVIKHREKHIPSSIRSTVTKGCNVVSLLHDDVLSFETATVTGFEKLLPEIDRGPWPVADPLRPRLANLVSLGDVWALGLSIMDILVTDAALYKAKHTPAFLNIFTLARLMIEVDPSLRITAKEAMDCFAAIRADMAAPVMMEFVQQRRVYISALERSRARAHSRA